MAKKQSFADKFKKEKSGSLCPVCGGTTQPVRLVNPEQDPESGAIKFRTAIVVVCKCNHKAIYG